MRAALVTSFTAPPAATDVAEPVATGADEVVVDVVAAGLHPRVRSQADGSHYTSTDDLPLIPGIDGVGRGPDGELRYFILSDTVHGSMAERTVIDVRRSVVLPDDVDPLLLAAAMNPAMSSWVALRRRIHVDPGASVLVLGATGSAGSLAIQVAKHLGAKRVVAAGRRPDRLAQLAALGADAVVSLDGTGAEVGARLAEAAAEVDVVLDYVWGPLTGSAVAAIVTARPDRGQPLEWVEIGSVGGPEAPIPSAALRAARLQFVGSGQGSVPTRDIAAELPDLASAITAGTFQIDARAVPLDEVGAAWADIGATDRIVLVP